MNSLPLDLLPHVFESLNFSSLKECSLVNHRFHRWTRQLLFAHLVLCTRTWEKKSRFLLHEADFDRIAVINKVTIELDDDFLVFEPNNVPEELTALLEKLGGRIETLRIDGFTQDQREISWLDIPLTLRNFLCERLMPYLRSLEIEEIGEFPILGVLCHCPLLQRLHIGSSYPNPMEDHPELNQLPSLRSFSLSLREESDLHNMTPLAQFIRHARGPISSLKLGQRVGYFFSMELHALKPFVEVGVWTSIQHLSFDKRLFGRIIYTPLDELQSSNLIPLAKFPKLQTMSVPIRIPTYENEWVNWFTWVAMVVHFAGDSLPRSFKAFRCTVSPQLEALGNYSVSLHPLDGLQDSCSFSMNIIVPSSVESEKVEKVFNLARSAFPSWDNAGQLSFSTGPVGGW
ncbi:hypothetical protein DL96DRAFT_1825631 [Flagelloscypha sp. PMI_526]|nr:hypothetical protein DL96DRAFT_1825631 [Flagelloscypha sp. PMI_526]